MSSPISGIQDQLAVFQGELLGIQAQVQGFGERLASSSIPSADLAGRITAVNEGLKDLSALLQKLSQPAAERPASEMRASPEPPPERESAAVAALRAKALPAPPRKGGASPAHTAVRLVTEARTAIERGCLAGAAESLNRAQELLRTRADPKLETKVKACREELRTKVASGVRTLILGGRFGVAMGLVEDIARKLNEIELQPLYLEIAQAQLNQLEENIPIQRKLEIALEVHHSQNIPAVTLLALTHIREICKNYSGIPNAILLIGILREKLISNEREAFITSLCDNVKKEVQEKVKEQPVDAINFVKGLLDKWPADEEWSKAGGRIVGAEGEIREFAKAELAKFWLGTAEGFVEIGRWTEAKEIVTKFQDMWPYKGDSVQDRAGVLLGKIVYLEREDREALEAEDRDAARRRSPTRTSPPRTSPPDSPTRGESPPRIPDPAPASPASVAPEAPKAEETTMDPVKFNRTLSEATRQMGNPVRRLGVEKSLESLKEENLSPEQRDRLVKAIKDYNLKYPLSKIDLS